MKNKNNRSSTSPRPSLKRCLYTSRTLLLALCFPMVLASCTTVPSRPSTLALPPANLMTRPAPLEKMPAQPTPQQVLQVSIPAIGMYGEVSDRLIKLQDWVKRRVEQAKP